MRQLNVKRFSIDNNIAYLIQQVTNDSTQEILGYFHGIATFVCEDMAKNSKATFPQKDIVLFYKESPVPYRLRIHGYRDYESNNIELHVAVNFPSKSVDHDMSSVITKIVEVGLGLSEEGEDMFRFDKPQLKAPRCLRSVRLAQDAKRK